MSERLTTLSKVKGWLDFPADSSAADVALNGLIDTASQTVLAYLGRDGMAAQNYMSQFRGNGRNEVFLRNWPIISITSVGVNNSSISPASFNNLGYPSGHGFYASPECNGPQKVVLSNFAFGYRVPCGVSYRAGYEGLQTITLSGTQLTTTLWGQWTKNFGVTKAGVPMVLVEEDPASGEYSVDQDGTYTFSSDDEGQVVIISFGYCPSDLSNAVTQLVAEWYTGKDDTNTKSKMIGGRAVGDQQTVTYFDQDMSSVVRRQLQRHKNEIPI